MNPINGEEKSQYGTKHLMYFAFSEYQRYIPSFALEKWEHGINIHKTKEHINRSRSEPWHYRPSESAPMPGAIM